MRVFNSAPVGFNKGESNGASLHLQFAMLQLGMADANKTQALKEMKTLEDDQAEQKVLADVMQKVRNAKAGNPDDNVTLDKSVVDYFRKHNISPVTPQVSTEGLQNIHEEIEKKMNEAKEKGVPVKLDATIVKKFEDDYRGKLNIPTNTVPTLTGEKGYTAEQLAEMVKSMKPFLEKGEQYKVKDMDILIQSLQSRLDTVGTKSQQIMVKAQDAMGKYNSYLGGANSVIQQNNQLTSEVAKMR